jgi:mRNA interferase RelE/StbE
MYQIVLSRSAEKDLDRIDKKSKPYIFTALFDLRKNPYLGKKLKGKLQEYYSLRVGMYRIIYRIYKKELNILIIRIGHRQGIYK